MEGPPANNPSPTRWLPSALALAALAIAAAFAVWRLDPPAPRPADAPADQFSAARALEDLRKFATAPHPIGSEEHGKVREYLVERLRALGLDPQIQHEKYMEDKRAALMSQGNIINILARMPGSANSKALVVAAHYDSVAMGPGASDDGAAVAAMLETARALKAGPRPKNDIIFLVTDAEEVCLCGAKLFVERHPWAKDAGLVLNFEARGTAGPSIMFETSPENGWLVERYSRAARHPAASSVSYEVYKRMPNDTDLTEFKKGGLPGLNFAFIKNVKFYHTKNDSVENLDPRSLQHHGDNMLAMAREFGGWDLAQPRARNAVYFDVLNFGVARYSEGWAWATFAIAAAAFIAALALGLRSGRATARGIAAGAGLQALCLVALPVIAWTVYWLAKKAYLSSPTASPMEFRTCPWLLLGFMAGVAALYGGVQFLAARRAGAESLALGAWIWPLALAAGTTAAIPGASYLFVWPLAFASLAAAANFALPLAQPSPSLRALLAAAGALPAVILWAPTIYLMFVAMTLNMVAPLALLAALTLGFLAPLAGLSQERVDSRP